jgi:hypothetical protein
MDPAAKALCIAALDGRSGDVLAMVKENGVDGVAVARSCLLEAHDWLGQWLDMEQNAQLPELAEEAASVHGEIESDMNMVAVSPDMISDTIGELHEDSTKMSLAVEQEIGACRDSPMSFSTAMPAATNRCSLSDIFGCEVKVRRTFLHIDVPQEPTTPRAAAPAIRTPNTDPCGRFLYLRTDDDPTSSSALESPLLANGMEATPSPRCFAREDRHMERVKLNLWDLTHEQEAADIMQISIFEALKTAGGA